LQDVRNTVCVGREKGTDWDIAKYCSQECSGYKRGEHDAELEAAILSLLEEQSGVKTISPSDAAKLVGGRTTRRDWEGLIQPAREAARRLVNAGKVVVMQNGRVVDAEKAKGALRAAVAVAVIVGSLLAAVNCY